MFLPSVFKTLHKKLFKSSKIMDTFQANMYSQASNFNKQAYDYFLVLDFEATCDDTQKLIPQVSIVL